MALTFFAHSGVRCTAIHLNGHGLRELNVLTCCDLSSGGTLQVLRLPARCALEMPRNDSDVCRAKWKWRPGLALDADVLEAFVALGLGETMSRLGPPPKIGLRVPHFRRK